MKVTKQEYLTLKHIIQRWAGRYASQSDVEVVTAMYASITESYPNVNLSKRLMLPNDRRLEEIGEALSQDHRKSLQRDTYATVEP